MHLVRTISLGLVVGLAFSLAAWGGQGKAGLWEIKSKDDMGRVSPPPTATLPPEVVARLRAHGMPSNAEATAGRYCMTAADVANPRINLPKTAGCRLENTKIWGQTYSTDIVCSGRASGRGHVQVTYLSPEHYKGRQTMSMTMNGRQVKIDTEIEGRWLGPDCGKVKPAH
jgi:hypothetical protein